MAIACAIVAAVALGFTLRAPSAPRRTATTGTTSAGQADGSVPGSTLAAAPSPTTSAGPAPPAQQHVAASPATRAPATPPAAGGVHPAGSAPPPSTQGAGPLNGKIVAIDPGHDGGNGAHPAEINRLVPAGGFQKACDTTGTQTNAGYTEAAFNLDVAQRLAADLRKQGVTVVMTRSSNDGWGPCIDQRAAVGNQAHANAAISIHADGGPPGGRGFHVIQPALIPGVTDNIVARSHQLALAVRTAYLAGTTMPVSTYTASQGLDTRGDLGGLNLSAVPKVFIECGNMRNATDAAAVSSADFRQKAADALAAGLTAYLQST